MQGDNLKTDANKHADGAWSADLSLGLHWDPCGLYTFVIGVILEHVRTVVNNSESCMVVRILCAGFKKQIRFFCANLYFILLCLLEEWNEGEIGLCCSYLWVLWCLTSDLRLF